MVVKYVTGEQKQQIFLLRKKGLSFSKISEQMGISRNTIKTFCWRNALSDGEMEKPFDNRGYKGFCKQCGKQLEQKPKSRPKVFCCNKCRQTWWNEHDGLINRKKQVACVCEYCGKEFMCYPSQKRKFCSHDCYIQKYFHSEAKHNDDGL